MVATKEKGMEIQTTIKEFPEKVGRFNLPLDTKIRVIIEDEKGLDILNEIWKKMKDESPQKVEKLIKEAVQSSKK